MRPFSNRIEAGQQLGRLLQHSFHNRDVIVLGLPRGGVPVAWEVAKCLGAELDVMIVRKLGHPCQRELAIGAIASGGVRVINDSVPVPPDVLDDITVREERELQRREQSYRGDRPWPALTERFVVLVDDGLATGATMRAAVMAVRQSRPARIVVAVPVAPADTVALLQHEADEVVCLRTPDVFYGVGQFYEDFSQTSDDTVRSLLASAWSEGASREAGAMSSHKTREST